MSDTTRFKVAGIAPALVLAAFSTAAIAGKGHDPMKADPAKHAAKLAEKLDLDAAQAADVEQILAEAQLERQSIGDNYTLNQRAEAKAAMKELKSRTAERIASVLNAEQLETFEAMKAKQKLRAQHRKEQMELKRQQREELRSET